MCGLQRIALYCRFMEVFLKEVSGVLKEADKELSVVWKI